MENYEFQIGELKLQKEELLAELNVKQKHLKTIKKIFFICHLTFLGTEKCSCYATRRY